VRKGLFWTRKTLGFRQNSKLQKVGEVKGESSHGGKGGNLGERVIKKKGRGTYRIFLARIKALSWGSNAFSVKEV